MSYRHFSSAGRQMLRMNEAPAIEVHTVQNFEPPGGMGARNLQRIVKRFSIWPRRGSRLRTTESAPVRKTKLISIDWTAHERIGPAEPALRSLSCCALPVKTHEVPATLLGVER